MGQYGWKIRNYKAATVLAKNLGIRDRYDYNMAMLHHSLFSDYLHDHGMITNAKDDATRDIICLDFGFGLRSFEEEIKHLNAMRQSAQKKIKDPEALKERLLMIDSLEERVCEKKDLFKKWSRDEIRKEFYVNGTYISYYNTDKESGEVVEERIYYKMLYRNPSKAKQGSVMFIREALYDMAYDWMTIGLGKLLPEHGAKIVEISAYAPLSASAIEGTVQIPIDDVLILEDQDSFFRTVADIVRVKQDQEIVRNKGKPSKPYCVVEREVTDVKNTLWDGMALIESSVMPDWCNGMALLRNHFFKACAFRTFIQDFFRDYCNEHGIDYETYSITDMYGYQHKAKDIKIITTNNATKISKFKDLIGGTEVSAYDYWKRRVVDNGCIWGIVKTDHPSKLGNVQQMSYQMINSLPVNKDDIRAIVSKSVEYVDLLKSSNEEFVKFLRHNATAVNHYNMLADLYNWNNRFAESRMFKSDKTTIISKYVNRLRKGKIVVEGDNLTVCGSPYALLLYAVGEDWSGDPTLKPEDGVIQVYTKKFKDGEFICGIRNPHNSANNLGYYKNVLHPLMDKYFGFSNNILAVNCINTDIQARMNGMDFDLTKWVGSVETQFKK